jgi:hypothetical protein
MEPRSATNRLISSVFSLSLAHERIASNARPSR